MTSVPAHQGFDIVIHILEASKDRRLHLEELGYTPSQLHIIKTAMALPYGAILIAGPAGSGKTTSIAAFMDLVEETKKIYSLEDPIENVIEQATQVTVNRAKANHGFSAMGQAALRMDPDCSS